jgi:predicted small lipoprotein YifL
MYSSPLARIVALTLILAGCGTKGPLTLPPKDAARPPASTAPAAAQPDDNKVKAQ